jgi:hypothetical protein
MNKADGYRQVLKTLPDWETYLLQESGLPARAGTWSWHRWSLTKATGACSSIS